MQNVYVRDLLENAKFAHNYSINKKKKKCHVSSIWYTIMCCFPQAGKQKVSLRQEILGSGALEVTLFLDLFLFQSGT